MRIQPILLRNVTALLPGGLRTGIDLRVQDGMIERLGVELPSAGAQVFDADGLTVAPGFIDLHIHGAAGALCEAGDADGLQSISAALARFGVTGFLATLAALPPEALRRAVRTIAEVCGGESGARILGIHLEGPYLNPMRAGAQVVQNMRPPSIEEFDALYDLSGGRIRQITLAPELEGALPFIAAVRARGVTVAVGHSNATAEEMLCGIEAGATHVTHLFNAMRELHHREPGVIGIGLTADTMSVELICDGHHVAPQMVDLTFRSKPPGKTALVSDAVGALGQPDGPYHMFGVDCIIADGAVRLRHGGNLAGSCLSLDRAVRNVRGWLPHLPLERILAAASSTPAAIIDEQRTGRIEVGQSADLVLLDSALEVVATIGRGQVLWRR